MPKTGKIYKIIRGINALLVIKCVHEMQEIRVMKSLAASFGSENDYEGVGLQHMDIAPAESTALFDFLSYIKNLKMLSISSCQMQHFAFRELAKLLSKDNEITSLKIVGSRVPITAADVKHITDALRSGNCKLTTLDISDNASDNKLTDEGAKYLSDALTSGNCKLTTLINSFNSLTDEGAKYLSDALKSDNCKLTTLNIFGNELTDEGAKYLSDALTSDSCKLTTLDISCNRLTGESAKYLSDALKSDNCKLTTLYISGNELTDAECAKYLSDTLNIH